jgi:hypothetical protein
MILALFTHVGPLACVSRIQGCSIDRPGLRLLESDLVGGEHDSFLQMPVVPPEYRSGDYIYRKSGGPDDHARGCLDSPSFMCRTFTEAEIRAGSNGSCFRYPTTRTMQ